MSFRDLTWLLTLISGRDGSVSIATCFGLDGPDVVYRWERDFRCISKTTPRPTQPPVQCVTGFSWEEKWPGRGGDHPLLLAPDWECVCLQRQVMGWPLSLWRFIIKIKINLICVLVFALCCYLAQNNLHINLTELYMKEKVKCWASKQHANTRGADRPGREQATATEDFEFHIPYL